ncbi:hypothetical protein ACP70R_007422 [Stipagrostis hirtigluma subsp. patula]
MSKDELLQGVEGLTTTVQRLMEQRREQSAGSNGGLLMITEGDDNALGDMEIAFRSSRRNKFQI